jgi:hypothetical protein
MTMGCCLLMALQRNYLFASFYLDLYRKFATNVNKI